MRGKSVSVRIVTPTVNERSNNQGENCFATNAVVCPTCPQANNSLHASNVACNTSSIPIQKSTHSNSLENENIQSSTFEGLTTPQSQLMKVLFLTEKHVPTEDVPESILSSKKDVDRLTQHVPFILHLLQVVVTVFSL